MPIDSSDPERGIDDEREPSEANADRPAADIGQSRAGADVSGSGEYQLEPPRGQAAQMHKKRVLESFVPIAPAQDDDGSARHFTIKQLLLLTAIVAFAIGTLRLLPLPMAAAVAGLFVLFGMLVLSLRSTYPAFAWLVWWSLVLIYLTVSAFAVFQGNVGQ